jgi:hypothetical protein
MEKRRSLRLEQLAARILPSAAPLVAPPPSAHALVSDALPAVHHPLAGHGSGGYTTAPIIPDVGITYNLQGKAKLATLGDVSVTGSVHTTGFFGLLPKGHAGGELTFSNGKGSVTIELTGPPQGGFSPLPRKFDYKVVSGTGAYAHLSDHGSLTLVLKALPTGDKGGPHGTFSLSI